MIGNTNLAYSEALYEATEVDKNRRIQRYRAAKRRARNERNMIKQRLCGMALIALGLIVFAIDHDCIGASAFVAALGMGLITSRKYHMSF